jgi:hypothetical protein
MLCRVCHQTSEAVVQRKEKGDRDAKVDAASEAIIYKIDVTANRYVDAFAVDAAVDSQNGSKAFLLFIMEKPFQINFA